MKTHTSQPTVTHAAAFASLPRSTSRAARKAALLLFSVAVLLAGGAAAVHAQSALDGLDPSAKEESLTALETKLVASDGGDSHQFGFSVATSGNTAIVLPFAGWTGWHLVNTDKNAGNFPDVLPYTPRITTEEAKAQYGKLPMGFVANQGQTDGSVDFTARGVGYSLFLKPTEAVFAMSRKKDTARRGVNEQPGQMGQPKSEMTKTETAVLRMKLVGANADSPSEGLKEQEGKVNYFIGNDESKWHTNISTFAKVKYEDVYAGIDLIYYGNQEQLEYDFIVAPKADYKQIKLNFDGAKRVEIEKTTGDLVLHTRLGTIRQHQPLVYQEWGGERQEIASRYVRRGKQIGFEVGEYDTTLPLVIDPTLVYSTFIGGSSNDQGFAIAVDSTGNTYITGETSSPDFPTTSGAFDTTYNGGLRDVFVTKVNAGGSALIYSTFIGGNGGGPSCGGSTPGGDDFGTGIAIDSSGNAYVTGFAGSIDFPTTAGAFDTTYCNGEVFVTKLNASGSALIYSTFIGGIGTERANGIAIDSTGNAYLTGNTSFDYPTTPGAFQTTPGSGNLEHGDVFVTKLNATGSALIYSTYIGGNSTDRANAIAIDSTGNAYVTGDTGSLGDYPTTAGAFDTTHNGNGDVFVTKLNATGTALIYSTFLGGIGNEQGTGIAVDSTGDAYVTGFTGSLDYPTTAGAFNTTNGGNQDVFVTKLNATGSALIYSTFLGGSQVDVGRGIAIDSTGNAYLTGQTGSPAYPTTAGAFDTTYNGGVDVFYTKLNASGSALIYSTFIGGSGPDYGNGIAIDSTGNAYLTGETGSPAYPTTAGAFDTTHNGGFDLFVTKIETPTGTPPTPTQVVSRKLHNGAPFDINLPLTGAAGIECRSGGATNDYQVVLTFSSAVTFNNAAVTAGAGSVSGSSGSGTTTVTVGLTGVTNAQRITVTLLAVSDGTNTGTLNIPMGVLLGDTNGNGSVSASDIAQTKANSGQVVSASNFRTDVNVNGSINGSDIGLVKSRAGTALP